jgi:hypothetical protein
VHPFLNGISACGSFVAALLFFKFWQATNDRLFAWFGAGFWMFAVTWSAIAVSRPLDETRFLYFVPRLIGFVLILIGIVKKNRSQLVL